MAKSRFSALILNWFDQNKRALPWRENRDPYSIWLSEIILQQTRVSQGLPYYNRFIEKYPTIKSLANASEEEVLRLWQGLGYYSRARNLHKCAKSIVAQFDGKFPETMEELKTLPGIGNYTSAAISSLAFDEPVPVVDGNVYRLLSRYFGIETDIASSGAFREFFDIGLAHLDPDRAGDFNQAMMEFGALYCIPKQPNCLDCVLNEPCVAFANSVQDKLPVKLRKNKVRQRYFHYLILRFEAKLVLQQRMSKDIWHGLYEFPLVETKKKVGFEEISHPILEQLKNYNTVYSVEDKIHRHILSHQVLNVNFVVIEIDRKTKDQLVLGGSNWFTLNEAESLPKPVLIANYLDSYLNSIHLQ